MSRLPGAGAGPSALVCCRAALGSSDQAMSRRRMSRVPTTPATTP
jgi:hypothetical protein